MDRPTSFDRREGSSSSRAAAAIAAGVFLGCSPLPGFHRVLGPVAARWLGLDARKIRLGAGISNPLFVLLALLSELHIGVWLRTGDFQLLGMERVAAAGPWLLLDVLTGWIVLGGIFATLAFGTTRAAVGGASSDAWYATLVRRAADRYLGGSITAWEFAHAKLRTDPVFKEVLQGGLLGRRGTLLDIGCGQGVMLALLLEAKDAARASAWPADRPAPPLFERLIGIETRPRVARLAAAALGAEAVVVEADARRVQFEPCSTALLFDVLQMMSYQEQETLLLAIRAALTPGGVILIREADAGAGWRFRRVRVGNRLKLFAAGVWRDPFSFRRREGWLDCFGRLGFTARLCPLPGESTSGNLLFRLSTPTDSPA